MLCLVVVEEWSVARWCWYRWMRDELSDSVVLVFAAMVMEQSRPCRVTVTVVVGVGGVHSVSSARGR